VAIKINLLPRDARAARAPRALAVPRIAVGGALVTQILAGVLVLVILGLGALGYRAWSARHQYEAEVTQLKAQNEQLKTQLTALHKAEEAKREIQRRIEVIGKLAKSQGVPLAMLTGVLRAVPSGVWLNAVEMSPHQVRVSVETQPTAATASETLERLEAKRAQVEGQGSPARRGRSAAPAREVMELGGYSLIIRGAAFNNYQVADFMDNLRKNALFSDVDFVLTEAERIEQTRVVAFEVTAMVKL
jgi:Tfp pilus assembly protein PilN